jgi:hypothetical protein
MEPNRPTRSRQELAALPPEGTEREQYLRRTAGGLAAETLVCHIRNAASRRDTVVMQLCDSALRGWAESVIRAAARKFGFHRDVDRLEDFYKACLDAMWDGVLAGSDKKPRWEENFGQALYGKCIDVGRPMFRRARRTIPLDLVEDEGATDGVAELLRNATRREILDAVRRLPEKEAQAVMLHYLEGRSIDSKDPGSVRSLMNLSPAHLHRLLKSARQRLAADPVMRRLYDES